MSDRTFIDQQDHTTASIRQEAAVEDLQRARLRNTPAVTYRPDIFQDGNAWCALLGRDIAVGVVGWGDSPAMAMDAFNTAWVTNAVARASNADAQAEPPAIQPSEDT